MQILPVNYSINKIQPTFGHGHSFSESGYSKKEKAVVAASTALGVTTALAILAKRAGYSLKPEKMFKNIKNSYLAKVQYHDEQVIPIGIGTSLGGLAGGYLIDKNPKNRKAKRREAIMQIGNVSIPILTVEGFATVGEKFGKTAKSISAVAGIFAGVYLANYLMNMLSNAIFHNKKGERGVKASDFSAHLDDAVIASSYISESKLIYYISRIIPAALMVAGFEVGSKKAGTSD